METSTITTIAQLNPIECINQNCYYNNWLVSIKQSPQKILSLTEEKKLIDSHILLKKTCALFESRLQVGSADSTKTSNVSHYNFYKRLLQTLIISGCSLDFFDAVLKHLQELKDLPLVNNLFSPDSLLQDNLEVQNKKTATTLAEYLQKKQKTIQFDERYHSMYYAIANNYIDILKILLELQEIPNISICPHTKCWNTIYCCIKEEKIIQSITDFLEKNSANPDLQIEVLLKLFLTTKYLETSNKMSNIVVALVANENYQYLVESILEILSLYISNEVAVDKIITEQHGSENMASCEATKQITANYKITDLFGKKFLELQKQILLPKAKLTDIQIRCINSKLQLNIADKETFYTAVNLFKNLILLETNKKELKHINSLLLTISNEF